MGQHQRSVPTSIKSKTDQEVLIFRNMLSNSAFKKSAANAPQNDQPAGAAAARVSTTRALFRVRSRTTSQMDHLPASRSTDVSSVGGSQTDTMSDAPLLRICTAPRSFTPLSTSSVGPTYHAEPAQISGSGAVEKSPAASRGITITG